MSLNLLNVIAPTGTVCNAAGEPIATGNVTFWLTDNRDRLLPASIGGGAQATTSRVTRNIVGGAITPSLQLLDPSESNPTNIRFRIQIRDTTFNPPETVTYRNVLIANNGSGGWNFATFSPSTEDTDLPVAKGPVGDASTVPGPPGTSLIPRGVYDPAITYGLSNIVGYAEASYVSLVSGNVGNTPTSSPAQWQLLAGNPKSPVETSISSGVVMPHAHDGTSVGSPTFTSAKFGEGIAPASGKYITLPTGTFPAGTNTFTLEAWIANTVTSGYQIAVSLGDSGSSNQIWIGLHNGNAVATVGGPDVTSTGTFSDGLPHHFRVVGDGATFYLFVDGVLQGSNTSGLSAGLSITSGFIGNFFASGNDFNGGWIDQVAVFSTALGTSNFTPSASAYTGSEAGLRALYPLDGDATDTTLSAATGNTVAIKESAPVYVIELTEDTTITLSVDTFTGTVQRATLILKPNGFRAIMPAQSSTMAWPGGITPVLRTDKMSRVTFLYTGTNPIIGGN